MRFLALVHWIVGLALLPLALVFGWLLAPILALGPLCLVVVGYRLWRGGDRTLALLRRTHVVSVAVAGLLCAYGVFALRMAERSAAAGGGLLGAFGLIPLGLGAALGTLALASLWLARGGESRR